MTTGATVWLTGLPSAGKTTIAYELAGRLRDEGHRVEVLDGDEIREFLSAGLGFSREDRHTNVQRIGFVAELLARNGVTALVPVIAPYADSREAVRKRHQAERHRVRRGARRDPGRGVLRARCEGSVRQAGRGRDLTGLTGVDDPYEAPETPDLRIESQRPDRRRSPRRRSTRCSPRGDWRDDDRCQGARRATDSPVRPLATWTPWSPRRCTSSARWRVSSSGR